MQFTAFAYVFVVVLLGVAVFARPWLPALLVFSTALQGVSMINVPVGDGLHGISPYSIVAAVAGGTLLFRLVREGGPGRLAERGEAGPAARLLAAYVLVAVVGAFILPHVFAGTPVVLLASRLDFDSATLTPLAFGVSNAAQAANLLVHAVAFTFLLDAASRPDWDSRRLLWGLGAAGALTVLAGAYERLALAGLWPSSIDFWMNNPGYVQLSEQYIAGIRRVVVPFSEASYASAFLAALWTGLLALLALGRRPLLALLPLVLVGLGLLNTLGATGWAAAAATAPMVLLALTARAMVRDAWAAALRRRVAAAWACALAAGAVGLWLGTASPVAPRVQELVYETVLVRADPETTNTSRQKSNEVAMQIVADTYGLGVGLGSHRASSYVASLASNTGLVGAILFAAMLAALLRPYVRAANPADGEIFVAAALVGATLAVSLSIPDLNIPLYWAFVFLAFFCRPEPGSDRGRVDAST